MKELIVLSGIAQAIAGAFSIFVFLYGLFSLIIGKFGLTRRNSAKGSRARRAGVSLILQLLIALVIGSWFRNLNHQALANFIMFILFLLCALVGLHIAGNYVRKSNIVNIYLSGKVYEEHGYKAKAIEHYERFLDLWKDADPGITEVEDAKKRLAMLKEAEK